MKKYLFIVMILLSFEILKAQDRNIRVLDKIFLSVENPQIEKLILDNIFTSSLKIGDIYDEVKINEEIDRLTKLIQDNLDKSFDKKQIGLILDNITSEKTFTLDIRVYSCPTNFRPLQIITKKNYQRKP